MRTKKERNNDPEWLQRFIARWFRRYPPSAAEAELLPFQFPSKLDPRLFCPVCRQPVLTSLYRESDPDAPCADCAERGGDPLIE